MRLRVIKPNNITSAQETSRDLVYRHGPLAYEPSRDSPDRI